jgi:hypothetical protein
MKEPEYHSAHRKERFFDDFLLCFTFTLLYSDTLL